MAEPPGDGDAALLLDMLQAARDARAFVAGMDLAAFLASRLHQNAVIRSLEVIARPQARFRRPPGTPIQNCHGARSRACGIG